MVTRDRRRLFVTGKQGLQQAAEGIKHGRYYCGEPAAAWLAMILAA